MSRWERLAQTFRRILPSLLLARCALAIIGGWCAVTAGLVTSWRGWAISLGVLAVAYGMVELWRISSSKAG